MPGWALGHLSCTHSMNRLHQTILITTFLPLCWLGMMAVHELGHVLAAWLTGGEVTKVVLHPLAISRTEVSPNPKPLAVVWAGPLVGSLVPLFAWAIVRTLFLPGEYLWRFFAGFCLIANGVYIGAGSFEAIGDAGDMQRDGSPVWLLWVFGAISIPAGLLLWHGLGQHFGLGKARGRVEAWAAYLAISLLTVALTLMFTLSERQ